VLDYVLARALKKNPDERYDSATEFASDLRDVIPDVLEAEAAAPAGNAAQDTATMAVAAADVAIEGERVSIDAGDESAALRPSPRFDCEAGLARLAVLPVDAEATRSGAGFTVPPGAVARRRTRRIDLPFVAVVAGYVAATLVAAYIVLG
jgi:hypothetical protein